MKKSILIFLAVLPFFAMAQKGTYLLKLSSVDVDGSTVGKIRIDSVKPSKVVLYGSHFVDSLIDVSFEPGSVSSINFDLLNKTKKTLKINWNEAAYINYNNNTGKVMHAGVKFIDRNSDQPATSIIGDAKISDLITPTDNVYYSSGSYGGWRELPLLPNIGKKDERTLIGKKIKILLPIISGTKQIDYVFTFEIVFNEYQK